MRSAARGDSSSPQDGLGPEPCRAEVCASARGHRSRSTSRGANSRPGLPQRGTTALMCAVNCGRYHMTTQLLDRGADHSLADSVRFAAPGLPKESDAGVWHPLRAPLAWCACRPPQSGATALILATSLRRMDEVELLLDRGANLEAADRVRGFAACAPSAHVASALSHEGCNALSPAVIESQLPECLILRRCAGRANTADVRRKRDVSPARPLVAGARSKCRGQEPRLLRDAVRLRARRRHSYHLSSGMSQRAAGDRSVWLSQPTGSVNALESFTARVDRAHNSSLLRQRRHHAAARGTRRGPRMPRRSKPATKPARSSEPWRWDH